MDTSRALPAAASQTEKTKQTDLKAVANDNQKVSPPEARKQPKPVFDDLDDMWDNMPV